MDEFQTIINDVIELTDFQNVLNGLGDLDTDTAMYSYIQKTRNAIANKPDMVKTQQHSGQMLQMYDYLIENWHTANKFKAIELLAEKEEALFENGFINYDKSDLDISDLAEHSGFFSTLADLYVDEIDELDRSGELYDNEINGLAGSKAKERREERRAKRKIKKETGDDKKGTFRKVVSKLNKVNPLTIAVRNALRGLIALNFLGVSSVLSSENLKAKTVLAKVQQMYTTMGGKNDKLMQSIQNGSKRKALFKKKMQAKLEAENFKGINGLGEPFSISALLVSSGGYFLKIWNWIKKAGLKVKEKISSIKTFLPEKQETKEDIQGKTNDTNISTTNSDTDDNKEKKWKKPVLIATAVLTAGGLAWWGLSPASTIKTKTETQSKQKAKSKTEADKLGNIQFT